MKQKSDGKSTEAAPKGKDSREGTKEEVADNLEKYTMT